MRAKKVDNTHGQIRDHLRAVGWGVFDSHDLGRDFADLVVARRGFTALVECKSGRKKLRPGQESFARWWPGVYVKANTPQEAELQLDIAEKYQFLRRQIGPVE